MFVPDRIRAAHEAIDPEYRDTPFFRSEVLGRRVGARTWVKDETATPIGSFKGRGVSWWMHENPGVERIVCASAGNFGQAVARIGSAQRRNVTVFASRNANPAKIDAMRRFGATVVLEGDDFDAAKEAARAEAARTGAFFLEDGREPEIAEGAGTIALECTEYVEFETVYVPIGNGSLAGGIGSWVRHACPGARIVGVVAAAAPAMERSWRSRAIIVTPTADTIADGIAVRVPVPESLGPLGEVLDDCVLVGESAIVEAMRLLWTEEELLSEPAGAVAMAGALTSGPSGPGDVLIPVCGRNLDERRRAEWLG